MNKSKETFRGFFVCRYVNPLTKKACLCLLDSRRALDQHRYSHRPFKKYRCYEFHRDTGTWCTFSTDRKYALEEHQKRIHCPETPQPQSCQFCDYTTIYPKIFDQHLARHGTFRAYKCPYDGCKYSSKNLNLLKRHYTTHPWIHKDSKSFLEVRYSLETIEEDQT